MSIQNNLDEIYQRIIAVCDRHGQDADDVALVAVSKKQPVSRLDEALKTGHRVYGENRVQEAYQHWKDGALGDVRAVYPDLQLHLIGPLQSNKAADAVALFDVIETVDRKKIARVLAQEMAKQNIKRTCFIQVNTGGEDQKSGVAIDDLGALLVYAREECGLDIRGLMCIPPLDEPAALHFALLKKLADRYGLGEISMGMSGDYEKAIALGATYIRVGTGVFGGRI